VTVNLETQHYLRVAQHAATLTRLTARIAALRHQSANGRGFQLRAACTAYDQALVLAAFELGVSGGASAPLTTAQRLTLEAELVLAGLRW
jgi:hypothetical protein